MQEKKILSFRRATQLSMVIFSLLCIFHLIVIVGIILFDYVPKEYLWGGRIETRDEFLKFEIISLLVSIFCVLIILIRSQSLRISGLLGFSRIALWLLFVLFLLNTVGNLIAKTTFEKAFALITVMISILCLRMALEPIIRQDDQKK